MRIPARTALTSIAAAVAFTALGLAPVVAASLCSGISGALAARGAGRKPWAWAVASVAAGATTVASYLLFSMILVVAYPVLEIWVQNPVYAGVLAAPPAWFTWMDHRHAPSSGVR